MNYKELNKLSDEALKGNFGFGKETIKDIRNTCMCPIKRDFIEINMNPIKCTICNKIIH